MNYRGEEMNIKLGSKINEGISAEIFKWGNDGKIIKLAKRRQENQAMLIEYSNSQFAWNNRLSVPQPFELIEVNDRIGIVYERIYGDTLMQRLLNQALSPLNAEKKIGEFSYEDVARISARLLSEIHRKPNQNMGLQSKSDRNSSEGGNYPQAQRTSIIHSIQKADYLSTSEKKSIVDILNKIPIKKQLCHGDPNLNNILIRGSDNKAVLIDWMYASIGNPEADLAEYIIVTKNLIFERNIPSKFFKYINSVRAKIIKVFIDEYTKLSDITYEDIEPWTMIMSARRLSAGIISKTEKRLLVHEIRKKLKITDS